jgi:hypothetical protein
MNATALRLTVQDRQGGVWSYRLYRITQPDEQYPTPPNSYRCICGTPHPRECVIGS